MCMQMPGSPVSHGRRERNGGVKACVALEMQLTNAIHMVRYD